MKCQGYLISTFFITITAGGLLVPEGIICWWTKSPRGYHLPSSQCFYHCVYLAWWTISLRGYHMPSSQCFYHCVYLYWWTISPRGYHLPSSYVFITITAGGLLVPEGIISQVVSVSTLTWFIRYISYWKFTVPKLCNYYQSEGSSPSGIGDLCWFKIILFMSFGLLPHKTFYIIWFVNLSYLMLFEKHVVHT